MLLENITGADDLINAMDSALKKSSGKRKRADDIFVRPYVSFHKAHWRKAPVRGRKSNVIYLRRHA